MTTAMHVPYLDTLVAVGVYIEFYDPDGCRFGLPTFPYRKAPKHLATNRQLRARQLRPGGQPVVAQILWRHKQQCRVAYLYDTNAAKPKRTATPAQRVAIDKALTARRTCTTCRQVKPYYIPTRYGECHDCHGGTR
jgi:hypothetical protein